MSRQGPAAGMDLREQSERRRMAPLSSGRRVLTLQGYDIENGRCPFLYRKSLNMIGGGYFQFDGDIRFFVIHADLLRPHRHVKRKRVAPRIQPSLTGERKLSGQGFFYFTGKPRRRKTLKRLLFCEIKSPQDGIALRRRRIMLPGNPRQVFLNDREERL